MNRRLAALVALVALAAAPAAAQDATPASAEPPQVTSATLANGMKVLLVERHDAPVVAFHVMFKVGSVDEEAGKTGLAHMFEHMIFKGTKRLYSADWKKEKPWFDEVERRARLLLDEQEKGPRADAARLKELAASLAEAQAEEEKYIVREEYEKLYEMNGAEGLNAYTAEDRTAYLVSLPSNRLEFWMAMEAERLRDPVLREFYKERDVVMEERRMRTDADPSGKLWEALITTAYAAHPYRHDVIGWMSDLEDLSRTDAERFFASRYGPNNAVAVLVGDLDPRRTLALLKRYFEPLPARPLPEHHVTEEPPQKGARRVEIEFDAEPQVLIAWHKPNLPSPDDTALEMLRAILSDGRTSRFYKGLVEGRKLASSVSADSVGVGERYPNLFVAAGTPRHPHTAAELEDGILEEIDRIKREPPSDWEMEKVRNQLTAGLIKSLESGEGMAERLAYYQTEAGDWSYPWELQKRFREITPAQIQEAARRWLTTEGATTATLVKAEPVPGPAAAAGETAGAASLEFSYAAGSPVLGAKAQASLRELAGRAQRTEGARVKVRIRSLKSEEARVTQRRSELALQALAAGGLPAERVDLKAESADDKPLLSVELVPSGEVKP